MPNKGKGAEAPAFVWLYFALRVKLRLTRKLLLMLGLAIRFEITKMPKAKHSQKTT